MGAEIHWSLILTHLCFVDLLGAAIFGASAQYFAKFEGRVTTRVIQCSQAVAAKGTFLWFLQGIFGPQLKIG